MTLRNRLQSGMAGAQHGMRESNTVLLCTLAKPLALCWEFQDRMLMKLVLHVPGDVSLCALQCQFSCATPVESASVR